MLQLVQHHLNSPIIDTTFIIWQSQHIILTIMKEVVLLDLLIFEKVSTYINLNISLILN